VFERRAFFGARVFFFEILEPGDRIAVSVGER
jgi:hypothetical protein